MSQLFDELSPRAGAKFQTIEPNGSLDQNVEAPDARNAIPYRRKHGTRRNVLRNDPLGNQLEKWPFSRGEYGGQKENRGENAAIDRKERLFLVALPLQQLALLVFAHLLAALFDHTAQRVSPLLRGASLVT